MLTRKDYDGWGAGSNEKSVGWSKATPYVRPLCTTLFRTGESVPSCCRYAPGKVRPWKSYAEYGC